jgi:hypothetical protein
LLWFEVIVLLSKFNVVWLRFGILPDSCTWQIVWLRFNCAVLGGSQKQKEVDLRVFHLFSLNFQYFTLSQVPLRKAVVDITSLASTGDT